MTTMMNDPLAEPCGTCGKTLGWHQENEPRHPFNSGQAGATDFLTRRDQQRRPTSPRGSDGPQIVSPGNDPVLRIALINRGILVPADLVVAEEQLRQALAEVMERGDDAQQAKGTRRGQVQE